MISSEILQLLESAAYLATVLGVLFAMAGLKIAMHTYREERRKDRLDQEQSTFNDLDDKYVEFMYKCTDHPALDLFSDPADTANRKLSAEEVKAERALHSVLISIFERAFVMFERQAGKEIKERQYPGWIECMRSYCTRESFLYEWNKIGNQFDADFQREMNQIIQEELGQKGTVPAVPQARFDKEVESERRQTPRPSKPLNQEER